MPQGGLYRRQRQADQQLPHHLKGSASWRVLPLVPWEDIKQNSSGKCTIFADLAALCPPVLVTWLVHDDNIDGAGIGRSAIQEYTRGATSLPIFLRYMLRRVNL